MRGRQSEKTTIKARERGEETEQRCREEKKTSHLEFTWRTPLVRPLVPVSGVHQDTKCCVECLYMI